MNANTGGPAFPRPISHDAISGDVKRTRGDRATYANEQDGMSLRDYFAGQALTGVIEHPDATDGSPKQVADVVYRIADAMLAQRATHHLTDAWVKGPVQP